MGGEGKTLKKEVGKKKNHAKVNLVGEGFLVLSDPCEMCFLYS